VQAPLFNIYGEDVVCRPGGVDPVVREDSDLRTTSKKKKDQHAEAASFWPRHGAETRPGGAP